MAVKFVRAVKYHMNLIKRLITKPQFTR